MTRILQLLLAVMMVTALMPSAAWGLVPLPPTVPPGVTPDWTPAPGSQGVEYASNLKVDLFRHAGLYYYWVAAGWRVGDTPTGPWKPTSELPPAMRRLNPALFKSIYKPKPHEP
jgi:hypothetical protein